MIAIFFFVWCVIADCFIIVNRWYTHQSLHIDQSNQSAKVHSFFLRSKFYLPWSRSWLWSWMFTFNWFVSRANVSSFLHDLSSSSTNWRWSSRHNKCHRITTIAVIWFIQVYRRNFVGRWNNFIAFRFFLFLYRFCIVAYK